MTPLDQLLSSREQSQAALAVFEQHLINVQTGSRCYLVVGDSNAVVSVPTDKAVWHLESAIEGVQSNLEDIEEKLDAINCLLSH